MFDYLNSSPWGIIFPAHNLESWAHLLAHAAFEAVVQVVFKVLRKQRSSAFYIMGRRVFDESKINVGLLKMIRSAMAMLVLCSEFKQTCLDSVSP
jgi:hypothetical protein